MQLTGLHHVSSLTAHAPENVAFYTDVLGLRLVKKTVNQDDPSSYHLFYGDELGNPGTEVTFFDIPHAAQNRPGASSISRIGLRVPDREALDYWVQRLDEYSIDHDAIMDEGGRSVLAFRDREGQRLALIDDHDAQVAGGVPWDRSSTPAPIAIRGLGTVNLTVRDLAPTARVLTDVMGFREARTYQQPETQGKSWSLKQALVALVLKFMSRSAQHFRSSAWDAVASTMSLSACRTPRNMTNGLTTCEAQESAHPVQSTATISARSTSANRTASCSNSPPMGRALPPTRTPRTSAKHWRCRPSSNHVGANRGQPQAAHDRLTTGCSTRMGHPRIVRPPCSIRRYSLSAPPRTNTLALGSTPPTRSAGRTVRRSMAKATTVSLF